jgi:beta-N-acetylhexosaminidase
MRRLLLSCLFLCACTTSRVPRVEDLSLAEKIGQMFVFDGHAFYMSEDSAVYQELRRQVRENHAGGVIWFASDVYETALVTRRLQDMARVPLLVSADLEMGPGMRFSNTTYWPPAMAVAATGDPSLAEQQGRITAIEASAIGVNHILAPVADVNVNPDNPVINTRSFGEDPADVSRFVAAFVRGVQSERVLATAKHFPGHGDTNVDTHRSLPVIDAGRARLDRVELVPFRAAIDAGVASVMIAHIGIPAVDPTPAPVRLHADAVAENVYTRDPEETTRDGTVPASLSAPVIEGILRRDLGFKGLVAGDAFDMGGLVAHYDAGEAAVLAVEAGTDLILKSPKPDAAIAAITAAVRDGRIPEARIDESVRRILDAKRRVRTRAGDPEEIFRTVDRQEHRRVAADIATRAMTLLREERGALPLRPETRIVLAGISDAAESANPVARMEAEIRRRASMPPVPFLVDPRTRPEEIDAIVEAARDADVVLLALAIRAVSGKGHLRLPDAARVLVERLPPHVKIVAVSFGSPYVLRDLPALRTYLCAWGTQPVLQTAAARALYGEAAIAGRLPVTMPGLHRRGEGLEKPALGPVPQEP